MMTAKNIKVLLLEDDSAHAEAIRRALKDTRYKVRVAGTLREYHDNLAADTPDIALLDMFLPDGGAMEVLSSHQQANTFPLLIMTSHGNEQNAVDAMKAGALDYIVKSPEAFADMPAIITHAIDHWKLLQERKWGEEALRDSEKKFRAVVEKANDVIIIIQDGIISFSNPRVTAVLGYDAGKIEGMEFVSFIPPENLGLALERYHKRMAGEKLSAIYETELLHKSGRKVPVESSGSVIEYAGKPADLVIIRDITERKQAEKALSESELRYRDLVNNSKNAVAIYEAAADGEDFIIKDFNSAAENIENVKKEDIIGKSLLLVFPGVKEFGFFEVFHRVWRTGVPEYFPTTQYRDERISGWRDSYVYRLSSGEIVAIYEDVTEHKLVKESLQASEEKYRNLLELLHEGVWAIDEDARTTYVNTHMAGMLGYTVEEMQGKELFYFMDERGRELAAQNVERRREGISETHDFEFLRKDGTRIYASLATTPVTGKDGEYKGAIAGVQDMTDRKRLEEERQRVDKLESIGVLAGGIAHDFNNILTSILGNISLAGMEAAPGSDLSESLEQAEKASLRAKELTVQLLTFAKGGAPVMKLASLTELLKEATGFALTGSRVKCRFNIPAGLWHAEIDTGQVSQIIQNLVINARQAMPSGGTIELLAENITLNETQSLGRGLPVMSGDYIRVAVTDHGTGIPEEHLEKIFDPFFTTKQKGNGLGLATSFSIARNHGGHISVESEVGAGSTFYLYLPASTQTAAPKQAKTAARKTAGKARILVMDDEKGVREIAGRMLKHIGYKDIEFAEDGAEAIKLYKAALETGNPFTVALLDLTIAGGMGGEVAIQKLLKIDPAVKAIVSSGYIDDPAIAKFREYGFSGVVAKPYTIEELRKAVQDVIG